MIEDQTVEEKKIISKYFSKLGKIAGERNKKKGSEYFKWVRSHGKKKKSVTVTQTQEE